MSYLSLKQFLIFFLSLAFLWPDYIQTTYANSWKPSRQAFVVSDAPLISTRIPTDLPIRRYRHVQLNPRLINAMQGALPDGTHVTMNLFSDMELECQLLSHRLTQNNVHLTRWHSTDDPDTLILLAMHNGKAAGNMKLNDVGNYHLEYAGENIYRIVQQNPLMSPVCGVDTSTTHHARPLATPTRHTEPTSPWHPQQETEDSIAEIDLLMLYTTEAKIGAGGEDAIRATCALYVEETNWILELSDVPAHINIIHFAENTAKESGSVSTEWQRLAGNEGTMYQELRTMRKDYGADLTTLIIERSNDHLGEGALPRNQNQGFDRAHNINVRAGLPWNYLLAHELGHNFGCGHDRDNAGSNPYTFEYSYGHRFIAEDIQYSTIMAYRPGHGIHQFSNPDLLYKGTPTGVPKGDAEPANNAKNIAFWSRKISQYYRHDNIIYFEHPEYEVSESDGKLTVIIHRSGTTSRDLTTFVKSVPVTAEFDEDYSFRRIRLNFAAGETSKKLEFTVKDDLLTEGTESLRLIFSGVNLRGSRHAVASGNAETIIHILDNDPGLNFDVQQKTVNESDGEIILSVRRHGSTDIPLSVPYEILSETAQSGSDFRGDSGLVTLEIGEEDAEIRIPILDDNVAEPEETLTVRFVDSEQTVFVATSNSVQVTIQDEDREGTLSPEDYANEAPNNTIWAVTSTKAGDVLVGGSFTQIGGEDIPLIARYNADGTFDRSFKCPDLKGIQVHVIKEQPDGKILLGGEIWLENPVQYGLVRLLPDGSPDPDFQTSPGFDGPVLKIDQQSDGSIITTGRFYHFNRQPANHLLRLTPDGGWDPTFQLFLSKKDRVNGMAVLPDDRILIGGIEEIEGINVVKNLQRLNADGSLDTSWPSSAAADESVDLILVAPDESIYLGGRFKRIGRHATRNVAKLRPNGTPDTSFTTLIKGEGPNGVWRLRLAIQPDGKLLASGGFTEWNTIPHSRIVRLNTDGSVDTSFDIGAGPSGMIMAMTQHLNGNIVIGGEFEEINGQVKPHLALLKSLGTRPYLKQEKTETDQLSMTIFGNAPKTFELQQSNNLNEWKTIRSIESRETNTPLAVDKPEISDPLFYRVIQIE